VERWEFKLKAISGQWTLPTDLCSMKILLTFCSFFLFVTSYSQPDCNKREEKIIGAANNFSAALLYNTYGMIGSISDGYEHDAYTETAVNDLLEAQKKLMDNLSAMIVEMKTGGYFKSPKDEKYIGSVADILLGLKKQATLMQEYIHNKNNKRQTAFEEQRKKNWKEISELMGIKE
jgi:hypothetical protein